MSPKIINSIAHLIPTFRAVRALYEASIGKMLKSFLIENQMLNDLRMLDPTYWLDITPDTGRIMLGFDR